MTNKVESYVKSDPPEKLLHDVITPLLTAKMNADLLIKHIPTLLQTLNSSAELRNLLSSDAKTIEALIRAPEVISNNIAMVQKKYRQLSNFVFENENSLAIKPDESNSQKPKISDIATHKKIKAILVVDDELIHHDIVIASLSPYYQVDSAKNGVEAISKCKETHYDVILMDLHMPKMDGSTATQELRKFVPPDTIIIGLSGMPVGEKRNNLLNIGFNDFLEKPFKLEDFQTLLNSI